MGALGLVSVCGILEVILFFKEKFDVFNSGKKKKTSIHQKTIFKNWSIVDL